MGKTSVESKCNIPGKIAWVTMEAPGFITLLYIMFTLPQINGMKEVPTGNWLMASLYVSCSSPLTLRFAVGGTVLM